MGVPLFWQFPKIRAPQYRPQYTIVLVIGIPKKVPLSLGNPHFGKVWKKFTKTSAKVRTKKKPFCYDKWPQLGGPSHPVIVIWVVVKIMVPFWVP